MSLVHRDDIFSVKTPFPIFMYIFKFSQVSFGDFFCGSTYVTEKYRHTQFEFVKFQLLVLLFRMLN